MRYRPAGKWSSPLRQAVDGRLNGGGIVGNAVPRRTEIPYIHPGGDGGGGEFQLFPALSCGDRHLIMGPGAKGEKGEHVGIPLKLWLTVQPHGIAFRGVVGSVVIQLKAGGNPADKEKLHIQFFLSFTLIFASATIRRARCFTPKKSRSKPI